MQPLPELPQRTVSIHDDMVDTDRWDRFIPREDDVFVAVPGKCGTTWTQAICALLIFQTPNPDIKQHAVSPWFDMRLEPLDDVLARIEAQSHRRYIKTHAPLNAMPYYSSATYLCVYRDFRDAFFSARNHVENMTLQISDAQAQPSRDIRADFRQWATVEPADKSNPTSICLRDYVDHYRSFKAYEHLPNIHIFHYANMKRDLRGSMAAMAQAMGIGVSDDLLDKLAAAAEFSNMKKNADRFLPGAGLGVWKKDEDFFRNGTSGQWRDVLTDDDIALYDSEMLKLLPAEDVHWLTYGSNGT